MPGDDVPASPLSLRFGLLLAGAAAALGTHAAWRAKATNAFKAAYATTWLTLGTATIMYVQPNREAMEKKLRESSRGVAATSVEDRDAQIRALRDAARR
jgi:hypothetical protein